MCQVLRFPLRARRTVVIVFTSHRKRLCSGEHTSTVGKADKMIENISGVMGRPVGHGLNFLINSRDCTVPLLVEEPGTVAATVSASG